MKKEAIRLEEERLNKRGEITQYPSFHERHRIFPEVFEDRRHRKILDVAAGVGIVGKRIKDHYEAKLLCNDISPTCLKIMQGLGLKTTSFDIDHEENRFPFPDKHFDAIVCLATIEHVIHIDHFLREIYRILCDQGYLYLSAPNYSGLFYLFRLLVSGKTFHDPMLDSERYEFYAHVRYFTYRSLREFVGSFGFIPDTVYLALPEDSSRYQLLKQESKLKAFVFRHAMKSIYKLSPRWAAEPVICFKKGSGVKGAALRKVII